MHITYYFIMYMYFKLLIGLLERFHGLVKFKMHLPLALHLVTSAQDSGLSSQTQADGTNNAGLASSIGSNNHVQVRSRENLRVVIGPVRVQGR